MYEYNFEDTDSASGAAPRMTEGEGRPAAIDDAAATRPSPANSPRVAAIHNPLSLRPLRLFEKRKSEPSRNSQKL